MRKVKTTTHIRKDGVSFSIDHVPSSCYCGRSVIVIEGRYVMGKLKCLGRVYCSRCGREFDVEERAIHYD